jgi:molybdopterin-guanine dinucleotide biosynthesis protein A
VAAGVAGQKQVSTPAGLTVALMAGGKSSRMGQDKSFVLFRGKPMIETVMERVQGMGDEQILITNTPDSYAHLDLPNCGDVYPEHGSLGGIFTAISAARYSHTLVVACDMPWLNRPLLEHMISLMGAADVTIPRWQKHPEPLHAIYTKQCLAPIEAKLKARRLKIVGFFDEVDVRYIERREIAQFDPDGRSFANINTPQELKRARNKKGQAHQDSPSK